MPDTKGEADSTANPSSTFLAIIKRVWVVIKSLFWMIKSAWKLVLVFLLAFSLGLNILLFVSDAIFTVASSAFRAVTGMRTVAVQHADEVAALGSDLAQERNVSRKLRGEVADLSDNLVLERRVASNLKGEVVGLTDDLAAERAVQRTLKGEVADLSEKFAAQSAKATKVGSELADARAGLVLHRGRKVAVSEAVDLTADGISKRAVKTSSREITSMAGQAVPYLGTAVIVGVTALELKDLCDTIKDMNELKRAFNPDLQPSEDEATVCSVKIASKEEIWDSVKSSPGQAYAAAREALPSLEDIKNYEFPNVDWSAGWHSAVDGAENAWSITKDKVGAAYGVTGDWVESTVGKVTGQEQAEPAEGR